MEYMCHESRIGMRLFIRKEEVANKAGHGQDKKSKDKV